MWDYIRIYHRWLATQDFIQLPKQNKKNVLWYFLITMYNLREHTSLSCPRLLIVYDDIQYLKNSWILLLIIQYTYLHIKIYKCVNLFFQIRWKNSYFEYYFFRACILGQCDTYFRYRMCTCQYISVIHTQLTDIPVVSRRHITFGIDLF